MAEYIDVERFRTWLRETQTTLIESARERREADGEDDPTVLRMDGGVANMHIVLTALDGFIENKIPMQSIRTPVKAKVRRRDPQTSWDAAISQSPEATQRLYAAIHRVLTVRGPMTDDELLHTFERLKFAHTPSGVRSRRKELVEAGWIRDSGTKRSSDAGSPSIVWEAVPEET